MLIAVAGFSGWRLWADLIRARLPAIPPPAHELPPPCEDEPTEIRVEWWGGISWEDDLASADAVIVARLTTRRPEVVQDAYCLSSTRYLFSVQDVVKGDIRPGEDVWEFGESPTRLKGSWRNCGRRSERPGRAVVFYFSQHT